jgi:hypothetical protein
MIDKDSVADPGSGMEKSRIRDPAGINIPDPQHWIKNSSAFRKGDKTTGI